MVAMPESVPTTAIGYTQAPTYSQLMYEDETTPELQWPQSIQVYDQMRKTDSQCASVLRAVTLPVRRTPWRIDPNGARPEVVEFVADDLGLPIVGQPPRTPPRTRDRFSWSEHLSLALLMLPLGHSYFEQLYRVDPDGNRAHLRKLEWRPSKTIEQINVAPDGGLISIKQYWTATSSEPKPIPVNRLVAYIHEREGGNWLGSSILRSAYKNFLLKERLLRVQAQTIERNGMGIPLYTGAETEESLAAGKAMATAWRSGAAAGSAIPFGASLSLVGVTGTLPDADPVVRYHDEAIARAVLAHFLNLGTKTGSWALGTTLEDFFTLSLQILALQIADTANKHIIEDLVDINFGPQEPAPRLVFDEIGSRQAATAQAIKLLVDAGLIKPDAVLDENLRQQYGLPPADPATAAPPPAQAAPSPAPDPEPVAGEGSVAASADTADLLDRALRIIAEFERPSGRPVKANRKRGYGSVGKALATLRTLRSRLSGALLKELDGIIAQLAGAAPVTAHGTHNQKDHGRRRTGALGSVLDKLSSLREKLSDEDRSTLDKAMDQLRGLESSDVDDDDLIEEDEDDEDSDELTMDSASGDVAFTPYADGDVDVDWDEGQYGIRLSPTSSREIADAVAKFTKAPTYPGPPPPPDKYPDWVKDQKTFQQWYNQLNDQWADSEAGRKYSGIVEELTTSDGELKVARYGSGAMWVGPPELVDADEPSGVLQLDDDDEANQFAGLLRQAIDATGVKASARPSRRTAVVAHGTHNQLDHAGGRRKGLSLPKVSAPRTSRKKAEPKAKPETTPKAAPTAKPAQVVDYHAEPWKAPDAPSRLASAFHDQWRETRRQSDGSYEPRVKTTKDKAWAAQHGTDQVDIANTDFDGLPDDWKAENKAAAETVIELLQWSQGTQLDTADKRNEAGNFIHDAWLSRNEWARGGELDVPFEELSKEEQDKDLAQYETALRVLRKTKNRDNVHRGMRASAEAEPAAVVAHLPGKHNQADHGRNKGLGSLPKGPARKRASPKEKTATSDVPAMPAAPPRAVSIPGANTFDTARTIGEYVKFDKVTLARNASLRSGKPSPEAKAWRARMAEAIKSQRIENDSVVYRGAAFKPGVISQLQPGAILSDRGVTSTDVDKEAAQFYAERRQLQDPSATLAMFEIKVPAGMPGYDADYGEFVFGPGSSMRILATRQTPQGIEVTAELIAPDGD